MLQPKTFMNNYNQFGVFQSDDSLDQTIIEWFGAHIGISFVSDIIW